MNTLESKLTAALRETGEEVPGGSVPPLRLHPAGDRPGRVRGAGRRHWLTRLTPLAAAAAVAGVAAGSLALSGTFDGPQHTTGGSAAARAHGVPLGGPGALHKVPRYYAALADPSEIMGGQRAQVRASATGALLATVRPPRPFGLFSWVSAAADDHTFILAAQRYWPIAPGNRGAAAERRDNTTPTRFFTLSFTPSTGAARLTELTIPGKPYQSTQIAGVALSPDGSKLAVDLRQSIQVITLATGARRTWTWHGGGWIGNTKPIGQVLSWAADGKQLAFQQWGGRFGDTARVLVLDTTAPGRSLSSAKVAAAFTGRPGALAISSFNTLLTPDGTKIVAPTMTEAAKRPYATQVEISEFSVSSGKIVRSMDTFRYPAAGGYQELLWTSPSGNTLIISDPRGKHRQLVTGVLTGNRFTPLPGNPQNPQIAW